MSSRGSLVRPLLAIFIALCYATSTRAQVVRGKALAPLDSAPLPGIVVQLADPSGRVVAHALTDTRGGFTLLAPQSGMHFLRALRIGWHPTITPQFLVPATGAVDQVVILSGGVVMLARARVTATSQCLRTSDSTGTGFAAWEEGRKALQAALLSREVPSLRLRWIQYERQRRVGDHSIVSDAEREGESAMLRPFRAFPIAKLIADGYVARDSSGTEYAAPDEEVLLSQEFAESHCIRSVALPADADSLVVAFEPTSDRTLPEVAGTMVIDRRTAALRRVTFRYVHVRPEEEAAAAGGEVHFQRLATGHWLVDQWSLRLPVFETEVVHSVSGSSSLRTVTGRSDRRESLVAVQTTGGEVYWAAENGRLAWAGHSVALRGRLLDSLGVAASFANVSLFGTSVRALANEEGTFSLESVRAGKRRLLISPTYRDSIGAAPFVEEIEVDSTLAEEVLILLPTRNASVRKVCGTRDATLSGEPGLIRGAVRDDFGGRRGAYDIVATWSHASDRPPDMGRAMARSTSIGDYLICGVPLETPILLEVRAGSRLVGSAQARVPRASGVALSDVRVPKP